MKGIPKNIKSLSCFCSILLYEDKRRVTYTINENLKSECRYTAVLPRYWRPKKSDEIVKQKRNFSNGFKLVRTSNGEFGYIRESDGELLPYRYDIAFDFNEHGLAMVGKDGCVSWIDKDFNYIDIDGQKAKEDPDGYCNDFKAWQTIEQFSKGEKPIAKLYYGRDTYGKVSYIDTNGNLMSFCKFDGKIHDDQTYSLFEDGTSFDEDGIARVDDSYLFARGYYITYRDLRKIAISRGLLSTLSKEAEQALDKKEGKKLRNVLQNPNV
jgi:hypothetical protein